MKVQVERLPSPPICYWPMRVETKGSAFVLNWLWFYVTIWPWW